MMIIGLGDVHGHWREAYALVVAACAKASVSMEDLDAILQVGDAEPQRNQTEADQVVGPAKYRKLGDFHEVVSGDLVFPVPVFFIAGNHEPFAALDADGGRATGGGDWGPNVVYLGRAGKFDVAGVKVAFLSGIYGESTFHRAEEGSLQARAGRHATHYLPAELAAVRTTMAAGVDVLVTHDWPTGVTEAGCFEPVGDERVRALIDDYGPMLSLHGHMHRPASVVLGRTQVECLAIVGYHSGDPMAAVGLWDIDPVRREVTRIV